MNLFNPKCSGCEARDREIEHLRGLVDRLMTQTWPKPETETIVTPPITGDAKVVEKIRFGADRELEPENMVDE